MTEQTTLDDWRRQLRTDMLARRQAASVADRDRWTAQIVAHLHAALPAPHTLTIGSYSPFRGEPDLRPLTDQWRMGGATIALPVVVERGQPMEFRAWWPGAPWRRGAFNLPEPDGTPAVTPQLVLMPPVGFDARGYRLGYGGGYFDRTLAAMPVAPVKVGIAFELARLDSIEPQSYDIAMDFIVTELGIYVVEATGLNLEGGAARLAEAMAVDRRQRSCEDDELRPYASSPCYGQELE